MGFCGKLLSGSFRILKEVIYLDIILEGLKQLAFGLGRMAAVATIFFGFVGMLSRRS